MDCVWARKAFGGEGLDAMVLSMESSRARGSLVKVTFLLSRVLKRTFYILLSFILEKQRDG